MCFLFLFQCHIIQLVDKLLLVSKEANGSQINIYLYNQNMTNYSLPHWFFTKCTDGSLLPSEPSNRVRKTLKKPKQNIR